LQILACDFVELFSAEVDFNQFVGSCENCSTSDSLASMQQAIFMYPFAHQQSYEQTKE
jgi:hypothetical protein